MDDGWRMVFVDGELRIGVQHAPDHVPPERPDGSTPQQIHVDLWVDDFDDAHAEVLALGARVLKEAEPSEELDAFQEYADPAGHPFCLCWIKPR